MDLTGLDVFYLVGIVLALVIFILALGFIGRQQDHGKTRRNHV
jgi:hypothetical protein